MNEKPEISPAILALAQRRGSYNAKGRRELQPTGIPAAHGSPTRYLHPIAKLFRSRSGKAFVGQWGTWWLQLWQPQARAPGIWSLRASPPGVWPPPELLALEEKRCPKTEEPFLQGSLGLGWVVAKTHLEPISVWLYWNLLPEACAPSTLPENSTQ